MNDREFFCQRHQVESATFKRVLDALPQDQFTYQPHERSPSALALVWTLANEMAACSTMIDTGEVHWATVPPPSAAEAVKAFQKNYQALDARVQKLGEDQWARPAKFYVGDQLLMEPPLGGFLWYLFFDAIHHRGQLSTYIRPMGGKVPSIYGPSGDDPGM
ncbi:MAG: DinB family protein [Gemmatimonadales bacterium]